MQAAKVLQRDHDYPPCSAPSASRGNMADKARAHARPIWQCQHGQTAQTGDTWHDSRAMTPKPSCSDGINSSMQTGSPAKKPVPCLKRPPRLAAAEGAKKRMIEPSSSAKGPSANSDADTARRVHGMASPALRNSPITAPVRAAAVGPSLPKRGMGCDLDLSPYRLPPPLHGQWCALMAFHCSVSSTA